MLAVRFQQDVGLFHGDLKSDNALIHTDEHGEHVAKLIDLGLSERIPRDGSELSPSSRYVIGPVVSFAFSSKV